LRKLYYLSCRKEDPGGYTHNRFYLKRLFFDSIDWLDNHVFDGTITVNATTYPKLLHGLMLQPVPALLLDPE